MASLPSLPALPISYLSLLFLLRILPTTISQGLISSSPGIAQCTASLLPLASCAPFVQGIASVPAMACCDNLKQLYTNVPYCLCILLNGTTLSSFPLNTTRALQLPDLCSLQVNISTCSGTTVLVPPSSPSSPVSPSANTNSTVSNATVLASPVAQPAPKPSILGLGMGRISASFKPRMAIEFTIAIAMKTFLFLVLP
ncbi:protein YLS3 isoform X2 [Momordica charantia]|uniref:Protein YLS3 isoform X2 n=1 Tax=Momordica charantia TaxID=3673 RepID=A0A6J1BYQ4_MOMCH|nr:protein YLS3 isoform X2 [Momordica charantia]